MKLGFPPPYKSLLFRLPSSSRVTVLVTNFQSSPFSTATSSGTGSGSGSNHSSLRRLQHEEDSRSIKVSVWWDLENCDLPVGTKVYKVAQSITAAIRNTGIKGPITITAFGDVQKLPRSNQDALSSTGVNLTHVPQGEKKRSLSTDLMFWVSQNPPPAHLFLISNDIEFASVLHRLRMSNYNVLLATKSSPSGSCGVLFSAASIMWDWDALIKGDSGVVVANYFNQPPDGPYNSWYGHYRTPLLDPFATTTSTEQSSSVRIEDVSDPVSVASRVRPVPKEVVNKIRQVLLSLFPNGVPLSELRSELNKSNVALDKEFYGYKTFSRFLQSMPEIFHVKSYSSFIVRARATSSPGLSSGLDEKIREKEKTVDASSSSKLISNVELAADAEQRGRDESLGQKQEIDKHVQEEATVRSQEHILVNQKDVKSNDKPVETNQVGDITGSDSSVEDGVFQKLKGLWSGSLQMESEHLQENKSDSVSEDKDKPEDKDLKSSSQGTDPMSEISPSVVGESAVEEVKAGTGEVGNYNKNATPGFLSQLLTTFKLWGRNTRLSNESSGGQKPVDVDSQVRDILAKDSSWNDLESFINSPRGFVIVSHSRTREMMAKNLQREGPSCLKELDESSMLHLVTLLISEKKWIEENPSSSLPFSIVKVSTPSHHHHASNGLSSIFSDCSKSQDSEKRFRNIAHAGVSVNYKSKAMSDCQKLIKKMTEKSPEGYSLIRFRKDFLEEYGYHLAVEKLGYESLVSLIQAMPEVRVSSGYILPLTSSPEAPKSSKKDESDSSFEELGPVSDATTTAAKLPEYEPSLSEDEDSGSEGENPRTEKKKVANGGDAESSLLQILDSYYPSKDSVAKKEKGEERKLVNNIRKQKPSKTYSFVKDVEV